jgi:hypothetical protein
MSFFSRLAFLLATTAAFSALNPGNARGQAPSSLGGRAVILTIKSGISPFSKTGSYRFLPSATDDTYGVIGLSGVADSDGTINGYNVTGTDTSSLTFTQISSPDQYICELSFKTATTGSFQIVSALNTSEVFQSGTFSVYNGVAPTSIQGWSFKIQIQYGTTPFALSGTAQIVTSQSDNTYQIVGGPGVTDSDGTYTYNQASSSASSLSFDDSVIGPGYTQTFSWSSATAGAYVADDGNGDVQAGTFTATPPPAPVVGGTPTASGQVGVAFSYQITATGVIASYAATGLPPGLTVDSGTGMVSGTPTAAGIFKATVSAADVNMGKATLTLTIAKGAATVDVPSPQTGTYTGKAISATATTTPSGLPLTFAYTSLATDKAASPVSVGSYLVTATVKSPNYSGSATGTLVISPAAATVTLGDLTQVYTGKPLSATATTVPAKLPVSFTYDPGPGAPTAVGSYAVTGSITNPDYAGSATGTLQITPVPPLPVTGAATLITAQTATLNGTVNPKGSATRAWFHYYYVAGTNTFTATTGTFSAGNGNASVAFTEAITGLVPATVYHYQAIASNGISTVNGALKTFTTLAAPTFNNTTPQTPQLSASGVGVGISVNPNGVATKAYFLYGTNSGDLNLSTAQVSLGAGKTAVVASAFLPGLAPDTTYYYEVVTVSAAGTFTSQMFSFTTLGFDLSVVAVTGQAAPGSGGGGFSEFSAPAINTSDGVAFLASVSTSSNIGIWANQGTDTLALITQTGVTAPDTTATFASFSDVPLYNNANRVAFLGTISGTGVTSATNSGVWSSSTGTLRLIARAGDAAPGGSTFSNLVATALTGTNTVVVSYMAVTGSVTTANDEGIWEGTLEGNLAPVLRSGDTIGGHVLANPFVLASSQTLLQGQGRAFASNSGDVAIRGTFTDKSTGIVTSIGGTEALAYASGGIAPGTGTATFSAFSDPIINVNDHVAFEATLASGGGVTTANNAGIWAQDSTGTLQLIARTGTTTPGFIALSDPVTNSHEAVAFGGAFKSGSSSVVALYCNSTGTLTNFAQTGQQAPGCAPGVKFSAFTLLALPDAGGATGDGGIVFEATLNGTGVSAANNTGIWAVDSTGTPQLIVRTGDTLNVASSGTPVYETVSGIFFSGFNGVNAGQALGLADNGDIAFALTFTDKSGGVFAVQFP